MVFLQSKLDVASLPPMSLVVVQLHNQKYQDKTGDEQ